jgi:hypothetical protein
VTKLKLPKEVLQAFKTEGAKGGKKAARNMTPEQRKERARKAAMARKTK